MKLSRKRRVGSATATYLGLSLLALVSAALPAVAATVDHTVVLKEQDLTFGRYHGFDVVTLAGCEISGDVGKPQLPVLPLTIALPDGARPTGLEIVSADSKELIRQFEPLPAQLPRILPAPGLAPRPWRFVGPDPDVYHGAGPYPRKVAEIVSSGRIAGGTAVGVLVHPVQYLPESGRLRFFSRIHFRIHYEAPPSAFAGPRSRPLEKVAQAVVANPSALGPTRREERQEESRLDPGTFEYVLITDPGYVDSFAPLVKWKTRKGVPATTVTVDWIDATYPGIDTQERVRNFILDARETWGAVWFLLGGDTQVLPARRAYAMTCGAGSHPDEDAIACDLYFADLDGTWDADADGVYGELADGVDLYPDVFVGRLPVRTNAQVQTFVSKLLAYEKGTEPTDHLLDMLMAAEVLWEDPFTDSSVGLNMIDREYVPPRYDPIKKLYETLGNESVASVLAALNQGESFFFHNGHAWWTVMGCGDGYMTRSDVDGLTNGLRAPIVYSIGCWPAAFDLSEDCIAEHFLRNPDGGALAFIGNSRYGWGAPGNPGYGYSDRFMQRFCSAVFTEGMVHLGSALAAAKAYYVPFSRSENVYRWHQYEINLLGDPEMPVRTDVPYALSVSHPDTIVAGASTVDVTVWSARGPVQDALVCLANGDDLYVRGWTGSDGTLSLDVQTAVPESVNITVTAANAAPYESRIAVDTAGPYLRVSGYAIDDSSGGNGDGLVGPGETVELTVTLENVGSDDAGNVSVTLSTSDSLATVRVSDASYGPIAAGEAAVPASPYVVEFDETSKNGHVVPFDLVVTAGTGRATWARAFTITVAEPILTAASYAVDDGPTGDGVPDPGEDVRIMIELENGGLAEALAPSATLTSGDGWVTVTEGVASLADVPAGQSRRVVFEMMVDAGCPSPRFVELYVGTLTTDGVAATDTLVVTLGSAGLADDFEDGATDWSHGGAGDLWALAGHRAHSGVASWYCGSTVTWQYSDDMNCHLDSPPVVIGANATLSFWCWYEVPVYHEDGLYIEVVKAGVPVDTLDFIGSGGALGQLGSIGNDWLEYRYDLNAEAGDTVQIRFRFTSDSSEVEEGFYIDDVTVSVSPRPSEAGTPGAPPVIEDPAVLHQNRPNPFSPETTIGFSLRAGGHVVLAVYNVQGRLIRTLLDEPLGPGNYSVAWDGKDELGGDVAAGVYLYRLSCGDVEQTRKMILVR